MLAIDFLGHDERKRGPGRKEGQKQTEKRNRRIRLALRFGHACGSSSLYLSHSVPITFVDRSMRGNAIGARELRCDREVCNRGDRSIRTSSKAE